jgi:hypothetical protein
MKQTSICLGAAIATLLLLTGTACHRQPSPPVIIVAPQMTNTPEAKTAPAQTSLEARQP